jgi:hypothetical protein
MTDSDPDPQVLKARFLEVVLNQMRDGDPPETKETYDRLTSAGYAHEETMNMLVSCVASEIFGILVTNELVNQERYVGMLKALPKMPWDE